MMNRVVLGLSGGVDSAVAASMLKEQGYEVHGLFLDMGLGGLSEAEDVARSIGIPFHVKRCAHALEEHVCRYFAEAYRSARTPNPCVVCNRKVKFQALIELADEIGAPYIATGHYARTGKDDQGRALLMRAASKKDQAYMLAWLDRSVIARCLFPLGEMQEKAAVRERARQSEIPVHDKKDSMDVCFIPDGDWGRWLESRGICLPEGNFVDPEGRILGHHRGIHRYTVGQRKGLGVASTGRLFVHELRPATNEIVLSLEDPHRSVICLTSVNLCAPEYAENGEFICDVRVRYSSRADRAKVRISGTEAEISFEKPVRAPAAGQFAVFYDGDIVIGGGFIEP
ncbi:MAG: tRNA 2-thiouridine(34) synthase MnmA [Butyricicoccus sp.]|nr:tRNA 2-thiouridine(34) synthase MnmA [Butyricicoccus sp.]